MSQNATQSGSKVFEDVFQNIRKAAETGLKLQQEVLSQWTTMWPIPTAQSPLTEKVQKFQKQWGETVTSLAQRHREVMDKQYQAALESLEAALRVGEATNFEEQRRRAEQLCRKTIDCLREVSETQIAEFRDAMTKWTELAANSTK